MHPNFQGGGRGRGRGRGGGGGGGGGGGDIGGVHGSYLPAENQVPPEGDNNNDNNNDGDGFTTRTCHSVGHTHAGPPNQLDTDFAFAMRLQQEEQQLGR